MSTNTHLLLDRTEQDLNILLRDLASTEIDPRDVNNFLASAIRIAQKANQVFELVRES